MPIPLKELFSTTLEEDSLEWNKKIFELAYCGGRGPFDKVINKLNSGFSVLIYLHGNCMTSAAEYVRMQVGSNNDWNEYGRLENSKNTIEDAWRKTTGIIDTISRWFTSKNTPPKAIFHNLDFLCDEKGGIHSHTTALTALLSLIESTRSGIVVGLSDINSGKLPNAIERAFDEKIWINEIKFENFKCLITKEIGDKLKDKGDNLPDGIAWLIYSRLRWSDPIRAVKIMQSAAKKDTLEEILKSIWENARSINFTCYEATGEKSEDIEGFPENIKTIIKNSIIYPFKRWKGFNGTYEQCKIELKSLPRGLILHGPSGCGKTFIARWIARSVGLPIRVANSAEIKDYRYGDTERNVHLLFNEARKASPCIIVLDDADDLFPNRDDIRGSVAGAERGLVNAALQELDGFGESPDGILVIMTTNRFGSLDKAIKTRLGIHIRIPYPLDEDQIERIIDIVAYEFKFKFKDGIKERLKKRFYSPVNMNTSMKMDSEDARYKAIDNLFSIREIRQAMLLLKNEYTQYDKETGYFHPNNRDFEGMIEYYENLMKWEVE